MFCLIPISFSVAFVVILKFPLKPTKSSISELSHLISITENGILCIWSGFILVYPFFHSMVFFSGFKINIRLISNFRRSKLIAAKYFYDGTKIYLFTSYGNWSPMEDISRPRKISNFKWKTFWVTLFTAYKDILQITKEFVFFIHQ